MDEPKEETLLPCPFCGGRARLGKKRQGSLAIPQYAYCDGSCNDLEQPAEDWNRRVYPPEFTALLQAAEFFWLLWDGNCQSDDCARHVSAIDAAKELLASKERRHD